MSEMAIDRICPQCGSRTTAATCPIHGIPTVTRATGGETVQTGEIIGGRYRVDSLLGKGGFGAVYIVTHITLQQQFVLKVLKSSLSADETQVKRFHQEARIACKLSHPNTVRVHDFGQTDSGHLYQAMELLNGKELGAVLTDEGTLSPERAIRIAIGVLKSLGEAHQAGLVHRDLKPDNIFLCHIHGEDDFVKVIDFGIAKPIEQGDDGGLTRTGFTVGTPKYMSPEQVLNKGVEGRSDLYALGVILYQCLSGELPISGGSSVEIMMAHVQQEPVALSLVCQQPLPDGLEQVVMRALRKIPAQRFSDAEDMLAALEEVVEKNGLVLLRRARSARMRAVTPSDLLETGEQMLRNEKLPDLQFQTSKRTGQAPSANPNADETELREMHPQSQEDILNSQAQRPELAQTVNFANRNAPLSGEQTEPIRPKSKSPSQSSQKVAQVPQRTLVEPTPAFVPQVSAKSNELTDRDATLRRGEATLDLAMPTAAKTAPAAAQAATRKWLVPAAVAAGLIVAAAWLVTPKSDGAQGVVHPPELAAEPAASPAPAEPVVRHVEAEKVQAANLAPAVPALLDADAADAAVAALTPRVQACQPKGAVDAAVAINAAGHATEVQFAKHSADGAVGACVGKLLHAYTFPPSPAPARSARLIFAAPVPISAPVPEPPPEVRRAKPKRATKPAAEKVNGDEAL